MKTLRIGLAGFGTVGGAVYRHLIRESDLLKCRSGFHVEVGAVLIRHPKKKRAHGLKVPASKRVSDIGGLLDRPDLDLIVEVMGGCDQARELTLKALQSHKPVITANKALLAEHGPEIFRTSAETSTPLFFEASVAGGIPVIQSLRDGLVANRFTVISGIINGTCNYILSRMSREGLEFQEVLKEAMRLGYAEADPTLDIEGVDAAHKAAILASLAFGGCVRFRDVSVEGIGHITPLDMGFAHSMNYEIKLLAIIRPHASGSVEVRVHPTLIPSQHLLASIHGVTNALMIRGHIVGDVEFMGPGAGGDATASAILSDVIRAGSFVLDRKSFIRDRLRSVTPCLAPAGRRVTPMGEIISKYYVRLSVVDRPGVMAQISSIMGKSGIGISSVIQPEGHCGKSVPLIFMVHDARTDAMRRALQKIQKLACVKAKPVLIPVETFES